MYPNEEVARMAKDAASSAQKWQNAMASASAAYTAGVNRVSTSPGQLAARRKDSYVAGVTRQADKWAARVGSVSLGDWQQAAISKGAARLSSGAAAAAPKFEQFMGRLMSHIEAGLPAIKSMPKGKGDLGAAKARVNAWIDHMAKFSNSGTRG